MKRKPGACELELRAVLLRPPKKSPSKAPAGEAMAMLMRRGLRPEATLNEAPFGQPLDGMQAEKFAEWLGHYAFRLFLRGAMRKFDGFLPEETTRYLTKAQSKNYAAALTDLRMAEKISHNRYRLKGPAPNFGRTLEWYVGRELERRLGFDVATGIKLHVRGGGGDLDIVAAAEGKLVYLELKSSPPKNLAVTEIEAFCDRVDLLRPDVSVFAIDTALRLSDKIIPMFQDEFRRRGLVSLKPRQIAAQLWAIGPHLYAVNGSRDLLANIMKAVAAGIRALSPHF